MAFKGVRFTYLNLRNMFSSSAAMKVALFGVLLIPVIFAGFYLSAFLDPYARLDGVAVAVVNEDTGAEINGVERNLGRDVCNELKNQEEGFQWNFVSAEEAQTGLEEGTYYMACTIPADFSDTIASADSEHPERANFVIAYDEGKNMLASQVGGTVWKTVQQQVNASVIKEYWQNVFGQMNDASVDLGEAADGAQELADGLRSAQEGNVTITANLRTLASGSSTLEDGLDELSAGSAQVDAGVQNLSSGMDDLSAGSQSLNAGLQELDSKVENLSDLPSATQQLSDGAKQVEGGIQTVSAYLVKISESGQVVATNLSAIGSDLQTAKTHLESASETVQQSTTLTPTEKNALATDLQGAQAALTDAGSQTEAAASTLQQMNQGAGTEQLDQLQQGASQLSSGLDLLNQSIQASVPTLTAGINQLAQGSSALDSGVQQARSGANQLADNTPALASGAAQAQQGASQITSGSQALAEGSETLGSGLASAASGSEELATGIAEGAEQMQFSDDEIEQRSEVMSEPIELDEQYYTSVENYGTGFAPFFLGLGSWVGCIFAGFLFKPLNNRLSISGANPLTVALVSYIPLASFAVLQTLIAQLFVQFGLGAQINHVAAYYGMGILCALCFMAIMQFLVAAFGFPGRFIAVVLLTLQLTSAAGTFPVETAPEFFQIISPWMPMTYLVDGLREIMSGLNMGVAAFDAGMLVVFGLIFFLLTAIVAYRNRKVKMYQLHPLLDL